MLWRETPIQYPCCSWERLRVVEDFKGRYRNGQSEWTNECCIGSLCPNGYYVTMPLWFHAVFLDVLYFTYLCQTVVDQYLTLERVGCFILLWGVSYWFQALAWLSCSATLFQLWVHPNWDVSLLEVHLVNFCMSLESFFFRRIRAVNTSRMEATCIKVPWTNEWMNEWMNEQLQTAFYTQDISSSQKSFILGAVTWTRDLNHWSNEILLHYGCYKHGSLPMYLLGQIMLPVVL